MFQSPVERIQNASTNNNALKYTGPYDQFFNDHGYGKDGVKLLHVRRDGPVHSIKQLEVSIRTKLNNQKEYLTTDNSNIVDSGATYNIAFLLAKMHGIENPETYGIMLTQELLKQYAHVAVVQVHVEEYPWQRISVDDKANGGTVEHNHAFTFTQNSIRYCEVLIRRDDPKPLVVSGIKGLRMLKTAQAEFVNFYKDAYTTSDDVYDRIFCLVADACWEFSDHENINYCEIFGKIKNIIVNTFVGDPKEGTMSTSSQRLLYLTEKEILETIPQISKVSMSFMNKYQIDFDTKPFQSVAPGNEKVVYIPMDNLHNTVYGQMSRKDLKTHL